MSKTPPERPAAGDVAEQLAADAERNEKTYRKRIGDEAPPATAQATGTTDNTKKGD